MSELISRQAAIDAIDKIFPADPMRDNYTQGVACGVAIAQTCVEQLPSAQPKHGRWIDVNGDGSLWRCPVCGETQCCKSNYCGDCGAYMMDEVEK